MDLIWGQDQCRRLRQIGTTGNLRMADMRDLPDDGESEIFFARRLDCPSRQHTDFWTHSQVDYSLSPQG
jgi:hypothetical protein